MEQVHIQIIAIDKNSADSYSRSIVASTKENFNRQVEEFENDIPFTKYYIEMMADDVLTEEQQQIVEDYDVN